AVQKLTRLDVEAWHTALRNSGAAPRTFGHAHRVLGKALRDAEIDGLVTKNVCKLHRAPKVPESEMVIVRDLPAFLTKLQGSRLRIPAMVSHRDASRGGAGAPLEPHRSRRKGHPSPRGARTDTRLRHPLQSTEV